MSKHDFYKTINKWRCSACSYDNSRKLKKKKKNKAIMYLGGKCTKCGYNKSDKALNFHHIKDKSFEVEQNLSKNWGHIKQELDKCILLCMNCFYEECEQIENRCRLQLKDAMKPKIKLNRKELNRYNSKLLGINPQP